MLRRSFYEADKVGDRKQDGIEDNDTCENKGQHGISNSFSFLIFMLPVSRFSNSCALPHEID